MAIGFVVVIILAIGFGVYEFIASEKNKDPTAMIIDSQIMPSTHRTTIVIEGGIVKKTGLKSSQPPQAKPTTQTKPTTLGTSIFTTFSQGSLSTE